MTRRKRNPGTETCTLDSCPRFRLVAGTSNCEVKRRAYRCSHWCWKKGFHCDTPRMGAEMK